MEPVPLWIAEVAFLIGLLVGGVMMHLCHTDGSRRND